MDESFIVGLTEFEANALYRRDCVIKHCPHCRSLFADSNTGRKIYCSFACKTAAGNARKAERKG